MDGDGFQVVRGKKASRRRHIHVPHLQCTTDHTEISDNLDVEKTIQKINDRLAEIEKSDFMHQIQECLKMWLDNSTVQSEGLDLPDSCKAEANRDVSDCQILQKANRSCTNYDRKQILHYELVCYGIGTLTANVVSQYQLSLLMILKKSLQLPPQCCYVYDPIFGDTDRNILNYLGYTVLTVNEEGKRVVDKPTLFYMPHCGKALYNNLLWANWNIDRLKYVSIIGNSFTEIERSTPRRLLEEDGHYILKILPFILEYHLENSFHYSDIFNNLSLHVFSESKLSAADQLFWDYHPEPHYNNSSVDIIQNTV